MDKKGCESNVPDYLYDQLDNFDFSEQLNKLIEANDALTRQLEDLKQEINIVNDRCANLEKKNEALQTNISTLYKTATAELARKDRICKELRQELDETLLKMKTGKGAANKKPSQSNTSTSMGIKQEFLPKQNEKDEYNEKFSRVHEYFEKKRLNSKSPDRQSPHKRQRVDYGNIPFRSESRSKSRSRNYHPSDNRPRSKDRRKDYYKHSEDFRKECDRRYGDHPGYRDHSNESQRTVYHKVIHSNDSRRTESSEYHKREHSNSEYFNYKQRSENNSEKNIEFSCHRDKHNDMKNVDKIKNNCDRYKSYELSYKNNASNKNPPNGILESNMYNRNLECSKPKIELNDVDIKSEKENKPDEDNIQNVRKLNMETDETYKGDEPIHLNELTPENDTVFKKEKKYKNKSHNSKKENRKQIEGVFVEKTDYISNNDSTPQSANNAVKETDNANSSMTTHRKKTHDQPTIINSTFENSNDSVDSYVKNSLLNTHGDSLDTLTQSSNDQEKSNLETSIQRRSYHTVVTSTKVDSNTIKFTVLRKRSRIIKS